MAFAFPLAVLSLVVMSTDAWDPAVQAYRNMIIKYNGGKATTAEIPQWVSTTRALRQWMMYVYMSVSVGAFSAYRYLCLDGVA